MMNAVPEYRRLQFTIADLLGLMVIVAVLGATSRLPVSVLHAVPLLAALYVVKYRILTLRVQPWLGLLLYFLVMAALVPYLYCCIYVPWEPSPLPVRQLGPRLCGSYSGASPLAGWIGGPIATFVIPTAFFFCDVLRHKLPSLKRSLLEIVILVPLCGFIWEDIELWLGWLRLE